IPSISMMLLRPDGDSLYWYDIAQASSRPLVTFNGTNYLVMWLENPGSSASLRAQFINFSLPAIGSNFIAVSEINASHLTGVSWDGKTFLAVWDSSTTEHSTVQGRLLGPDGVPIGPVLDISSAGAIATNSATTAKASHLVIWMESMGPTNEWHTRSRA